MTNQSRSRVGILWRSDARDPEDREEHGRLAPVFESLERREIAAVAVHYSEERASAVHDLLLQLDAVLVWVDPITDGRDRSQLDTLLREAAAAGVWVSADPEVILAMGTKEVLVTTQNMAWGTPCSSYKSPQELRAGLTATLAQGIRVLKQSRGNGGNGVWKVELDDGDGDGISAASRVKVLHALRGSSIEEMTLGDFIERCTAYFAGEGFMVDQPYQPRLGEGMVRCYMVQDRVAGFGKQLVTALLPPPAGSIESQPPPPRLYYGSTLPELQGLKNRLEAEWIPEMARVLGLSTSALPAIWDADFLLGPTTSTGEDTYVLCEINVSSVLPFPDEALEPLADAVARRVKASRAG